MTFNTTTIKTITLWIYLFEMFYSVLFYVCITFYSTQLYCCFLILPNSVLIWAVSQKLCRGHWWQCFYDLLRLITKLWETQLWSGVYDLVVFSYKFYSVLHCTGLFSAPFYFVLLCSILPCSALFSTLFYSVIGHGFPYILLYSILIFYSILFCFIMPLCSILLFLAVFCFILISSLYSIFVSSVIFNYFVLFYCFILFCFFCCILFYSIIILCTALCSALLVKLCCILIQFYWVFYSVINIFYSCSVFRFILFVCKWGILFSPQFLFIKYFPVELNCCFVSFYTNPFCSVLYIYAIIFYSTQS